MSDPSKAPADDGRWMLENWSCEGVCEVIVAGAKAIRDEDDLSDRASRNVLCVGRGCAEFC